jgi:hypothetical protein
MLQVKVEINEKLFAEFSKIRRRTAEAIAGLVAEEFDILLHNSPQYTGNFVANMAIQAGLGGAKGAVVKPAKEFFPQDITREQAMARGQLPAIMAAKRRNPNIVKNMTRHINYRTGWITGVSIYNPWEDAEIVEGLSPGQLRPVNKEGAHPLDQAKARLQQRANQTIFYDSAEFHRLRNIE